MVVAALAVGELDKAVAAFEALGVCHQLAEAAAGLGWKTPSSIQVQAIPHLLQGTAFQHASYPANMSLQQPAYQQILLQTETS